jgi:hypothetical protein
MRTELVLSSAGVEWAVDVLLGRVVVGPVQEHPFRAAHTLSYDLGRSVERGGRGCNGGRLISRLHPRPDRNGGLQLLLGNAGLVGVVWQDLGVEHGLDPMCDELRGRQCSRILGQRKPESETLWSNSVFISPSNRERTAADDIKLALARLGFDRASSISAARPHDRL